MSLSDILHAFAIGLYGAMGARMGWAAIDGLEWLASIALGRR